jgi:HEAT repeat protein
MTIDPLISELRRCAGLEDLEGASVAAEKLAALDSDAAAAALVSLLEQLDDIDLTDDAGDGSDEVWRTRQAVIRGLERCGHRAIEPLRALIARPPSKAGEAALLVLAKLADHAAAPVAIDWVSRGVMAALVPLGLLAPPGAVELLARAIDNAAPPNDGWIKRLAAHALGKIDTGAALDVLEPQLRDADWFARLGAVEALRDMDGDRASRLLEQATRDPDTRVAAAASVGRAPSRELIRPRFRS